MPAPGVVVVGAGLAGLQVASALREMGYAGTLTLVGDEPSAPYHRPPLSKAFLLGSSDAQRLAMRPDSFYADRQIELCLGTRVIAIDRGQRCARLADGRALSYEHLVLAVGARNRALTIEGVTLSGVHGLRTLVDAKGLLAGLQRGRRIVVIGAGFIGLEVAAAARSLGCEVTVLDVAERAMARAVSVPVSAVFAQAHRDAGVQLRFNTMTRRLHGEAGRVAAIETSSGEIIDADLVLVGIGVQANSELAADCGLRVDNGIVVDAQMCTIDPAISALGDCAAHPNAYAGGALVRLESVQNASDQARVIATRLIGKKPHDYTSVPWFWSDQGPLKLQIAGLTSGHDRTVVRGDAAPSCTVFCYRGEQLLGIETINRPGDHMAARKLIAQRIALSSAQADDQDLDLKQLATAMA